MQVARIPRNSLIWILASHIAVITPHLSYLSVWLIFTSLVCVVWRIMVFQSHWHFPGKIIRAILVIGGGTAILVQYNTQLGAEAGVALLIMSFSLKLLEMKTKRDVYLQVLLAYFVVSVAFLFNKSMLESAYLAFVSLIITATLIALNQTLPHGKPWPNLKLACVLFLQACPIMLALFIFFPRMPPIWALEVSGNGTNTGLRNAMSPTDIAKLGQSSALAFRAEFKGDPPQHKDLYWRALVFSHFDGKIWSASKTAASSINSYPYIKQKKMDINYIDHSYEYKVLIEPTHQRYLVALDIPVVPFSGISMTEDFRLVYHEPIDEPLQYKVTSFLNHTVQTELSEWQRFKDLQLPYTENERATALAKQWFEESDGDAEIFINRVLNWINQDTFSYTLKPPKLNSNIVDRFLFDTKKGYCAHYAGAFVYLMRAAGIPARVVGGYLGGEINQIGQYILVHQFEAHAWAEVWLPERGWIRVDPTASVAPERILDSVEGILRQEGSFLANQPFSPLRFRNNTFINIIRHSADYINYSWDRHVVGYDGQYQRDFLEKYFSAITPERMAVLMMALLGLILLAVTFILFRIKPSVNLTEMDKLYRSFYTRLQKLGVHRNTGETPLQFQVSAINQLPQYRSHIEVITKLYIEQQYLPKNLRTLSSQKAIQEIKQRLKLF